MSIPAQPRHPAPVEALSHVAAWLALIVALLSCAGLAPAVWRVQPSLTAAGPGGALILAALAGLAPQRFSPWTAALWSVLALLASAARLAETGPDPILGAAPETTLVMLLGVVYAVAAGYVASCALLDVRMKAVLLVLGAWGAFGVALALAKGLTLWDLVVRRGNPLAATSGSPYLDPTFLGVNAFLICALAAGLFDLFARLVRRDWRGGGAVLVAVLTMFAGERYLLERYDARGLPSFRTVVREAVHVPAARAEVR